MIFNKIIDIFSKHVSIALRSRLQKRRLFQKLREKIISVFLISTIFLKLNNGIFSFCIIDTQHDKYLEMLMKKHTYCRYLLS